MCKVYTGYCGTIEIEHGLCACTVDNPLAKARGLSLRTGAQTMLYHLSAGYYFTIALSRAPVKNVCNAVSKALIRQKTSRCSLLYWISLSIILDLTLYYTGSQFFTAPAYIFDNSWKPFYSIKQLY